MAYLVLENGMVFPGKRIGAKKDACGEMIFTTGVVGYVEALTSPENAGLVVVQTFPVMGNYGVTEEDAESAYTPAAYVVRSLCESPSNFRSQMGLNDFLMKKGIPGMEGVDTRRLTAVLREQGTMKAMIADEVPGAASFPCGKVTFLPVEERLYPAIGEKKGSVTLIDLGAKKSLIRGLQGMGFDVKTVSADAMERLPAEKPDGVIIAGGPGSPEDYEALLPEIKKVLGSVPVLAVGMGHLLVARALGAEIKKMHVGHHGQNQPVFCALDGRTYITAQSHNCVVEMDSLLQGEAVYRNLNDNTCEGVLYAALRCLTVQFDPDEAVLHRFAALMGGEKHA